jgi:hypothetical protein
LEVLVILEQDVILGTFTHRTDYLPGLLQSVKENFPDIPFIVQLVNLPINKNMEELRKKFSGSKKRYWVFLDDDIKFLHPDTIKIALQFMIKNRWGLTGIYSTFDPNYQNDVELVEKEVGWIPGYFQMVDSFLFGNVQPDLDLPDPNTAIDTSYCCSIKSKGGKIGIAPTVLYHQWKPIKGWDGQEIVDKTNDYLFKKWGSFYNRCITNCGCVVGKVPNGQEPGSIF